MAEHRIVPYDITKMEGINGTVETVEVVHTLEDARRITSEHNRNCSPEEQWYYFHVEGKYPCNEWYINFDKEFEALITRMKDENITKMPKGWWYDYGMLFMRDLTDGEKNGMYIKLLHKCVNLMLKAGD